MTSSHRWKVTVDLHGHDNAQPYHGPDDDGAMTKRTTSGTAWQGIGPNPESAREYAHDARATALLGMQETVERLETALSIAVALRTSDAAGPDGMGRTITVDAEVVDEVRRLLGEHQVPTQLDDLDVERVREWVTELRGAL